MGGGVSPCLKWLITDMKKERIRKLGEQMDRLD